MCIILSQHLVMLADDFLSLLQLFEQQIDFDTLRLQLCGFLILLDLLAVQLIDFELQHFLIDILQDFCILGWFAALNNQLAFLPNPIVLLCQLLLHFTQLLQLCRVCWLKHLLALALCVKCTVLVELEGLQSRLYFDQLMADLNLSLESLVEGDLVLFKYLGVHVSAQLLPDFLIFAFEFINNSSVVCDVGSVYFPAVLPQLDFDFVRIA